MPGGPISWPLVAAFAAFAVLGAVLWLGPVDGAPSGPERDGPAPGSHGPGAPSGSEPAAPTGAESASRLDSGPIPEAARIPDEETSTPEADTPEEGRSFSIGGSGDLLIHSPVYQAARTGADFGPEYDFTPMFAQVQPVISEIDLAICHLEVPLSEDNTDLSGYPLFMGPRELAGDIAAAGFDACSVASNHSVDQGSAGVVSTLDALDEAGVAHAGTARTEEEAEEPALHEVGGVTVGHISYTYGLNGLPLPEPWMVDLLDGDAIIEDARDARDAGAEFVVASLHWGLEYRQEPTEEQRDLAEQLLEDGSVDLILGHHAHVVQPIDRIDDRVVVFGLGNFLSNQSAACCPPETQDGVIVIVDVEETAPGEFDAVEVRAVPTWVDRDDGYVIVDVVSELERDDLSDGRRETLEISRERTESALSSGRDDDPAEIVGGARVVAGSADLDEGTPTTAGRPDTHPRVGPSVLPR